MGNNQIKDSFSEVLEKNFDASQLRETYLPQSFKDCSEAHAIQFYNHIGKSNLQSDDYRFLNESMRKCFPYNSSINFGGAEQREDLWNQTARELWQTGYTQWQHILATLHGESYKNIVMSQNSNASQYEYLFYTRSMMLCANFMLRFQGGAEVKDIHTYFRETFDQATTQYAFVTSAQTVFLDILNGLIGSVMQNPANLSKAIESLLMATQGIKTGSLSSEYYSPASMQIDLLLKKIRGLVLQVIQNEDLQDSNLKMMCVELLMRMGAASANPEDLILAAHYQFTLKIDISQHLDFFLIQDENYIEPKLDDDKAQEENADQFSNTSKKRIQDRCSYNGNGSDRQHSHDKMWCDGANYYSFCSERGLTRALKQSDGKWEHQKTNGSEEIKKLKWPTFLEHQGKHYVRHQGAPDVPFQVLNNNEMSIAEEQKPIVPADGEENNRFKWTNDDDPPIMKDGIGKRVMLCTPMASDGKFIYTLVKYNEEDRLKAIFCEKYQLLQEENQIKFEREFQLFKSDKENDPWCYKKNLTENGGYFDHGHLTCNGKHLIWSSKRNYHIFDLENGQRVKKQNMHGGAHLTMFDKITSKFYTCDADCYSWLEEWSISGFKMPIVNDKNEEEDVSLPDVPIILDAMKTNIRKVCQKVKQPDYKLNLFAQLIGGEMQNQSAVSTDNFYKTEREKIKQELAEKKANANEEQQEQERELNELKEQNLLYDCTRAIILSHCSNEARKRDFHARMQTKQLDGNEMLKYFKQPYGIFISESIFQTIRIAMLHVLSDYQMQTCHITEMFTLKSLLHLYISHIGCLRPLKLSISQIMSSQEMAQQQELLKKLKLVQLFPGQNKNPDKNDEIDDKSCFQLHIYHLAQQAVNEMENLISTKTMQEKLDDNLQLLKKFEQTDDTRLEIARNLKRYTGSDFDDIYNDDESVLSKFHEMFLTVLNLIEKQILKKVKKMVKSKDDIDDNCQGYGNEETQRLLEFAFNAINELMITFGSAKKAVLENQPNKDAGEEDALKETKKKQNLEKAEAKIERLNTFFYQIMIDTCSKFKSIMHLVVKEMLSSEFPDFEKDDYLKLSSKFDLLLTGKISILKAIQVFVMTIQLYEVGTTDLDEVTEALQSAVEGCQYFVAASQTLLSINEEFSEANKTLYSEIGNTHRFLAFALSKVASRLINGQSETETSDLTKFTILRNGIAEKFIPKLSAMCKKEIEGSFKITQDKELRQLTEKEPDSVQLDNNDHALNEIMKNNTEASQKLITILKEGVESNRDSSEERKANDPKVEELIRHSFAVMICFQDLYDKLEEAKGYDTIDEIPQSITDTWIKAESMRSWEHKTFDQMQRDLKPIMTEEFKKQYHEDHPSLPKIEGKLSDDQQKSLDEMIDKKAKEDLQKAFQDAKQKCEFLIMFETKDVLVQLNDSNIDPIDHSKLWSGWNPKHTASSKDKAKPDAPDVNKKRETIRDEVVELIQKVSTSAEKLQNFTEMGQIKGLRRLAGLVMINKTLETNENEIFYDALHIFEASLRRNQAKLCHYLDGVPCCGARTEREIRKKFFRAIDLITQMIRRESDSYKLVNLLNALLWDYQTEDLEVLARAEVFRTLSGDQDYSYCKFNTLYNAWGREDRCYSIENLEQERNTSREKYSLSARLRQCFDFLAMKVFSVVYNQDGRPRSNTLRKICSTVIASIQEIVFSKFDRHLEMLQHNTPLAANDRDEDIRFDNEKGEKYDQNDVYMIDQFVELGQNCIQKAEENYKKELNAKLRVIEKFIKQQQGEENVINLSGSIASEGVKEFGFEGSAMLYDSLLRREWRVISWILAHASTLAEDLNIEMNEEEKKADQEEAKNADSDEDKIASMKAAVNAKSNKVEEWITQIQGLEGNENSLTKAKIFSRISIVRLLKNVMVVVKLAESSQDAANLLTQVLNPQKLSVLIRLSAHGSSHVQCLVQKIFQTLLKCGIEKDILDQAVSRANGEDKTLRVKELIQRYCESVNMRSDFWTFQFNQIYLTKHAQFKTSDQVEVGKPAVIEEIIRTFEIVIKENLSHADVIRDVIILSLKKIDERKDFEIATLFSLVPESHSPIISTGKRCRDLESDDEFICLGFTQADRNNTFETRLSMVPMNNTNVVGLMINKGSQKIQIQKSYSLMNVTMVSDIDVSAIKIEGSSTTDIQEKQREITKESSIYMNPEIVSLLISRMTRKDNVMRSQPEKAIQQQLLQTYILNGIFHMLEIFQQMYLIVLKSYNQLETLINFLAKESANQKIKPDEPLVSVSMMQHLASEVFMSATHTNRSTGYFAKFFIYIDENTKSGALLQRLTDESNHSEFIDIGVLHSYGDDGRTPSMCDENHEIANIYGGENDSEIKCRNKTCDQSINSIQKVSQKKTGYMKCLECTNEIFYCNECKPNPQVRKNMGLDVSIKTLNIYRMSRHEAIFVKSADLSMLTDGMLTLMINSNVIIIEQNNAHTLESILEKLAIKIQQDNRWKACATCRFLIVSGADFEKASSFINGDKVNIVKETRGSLLTKIYKKVEIAQKRINNTNANHEFVTKFLQDKGLTTAEFLSQNVENILREEIGKDLGEEVKERQREEKKMQDQLKALNDDSATLETSSNATNTLRSMISSSQEQTPDFSKKFTEDSDKLIQEGGKEFFTYHRIQHNQSDYRSRFDEIVFEKEQRNPGELQRRQLNSCLGKMCQIMARDIWLRLMSEVTDEIDYDTKNIINATAMHPKICDLIHDSNMSASYQQIYFGDKGQVKIVREHIIKLLKYFDKQSSGGKFISFFVKDFLKRADITIDQVRKDNYSELSSYKLKDLRKVSRLSNVFDPNNLLFLSKQIFDLEKFLTGNIKTEMAKVVFDLHFGFAILFKSEEDAVVCQELVKGCCWALDILIDNIDTFVSNPDSVHRLLTSEMIEKIFEEMDKNEQSNEQNTNKKKLIYEIIIKLNKIYNFTKKRNPDTCPLQTPFKKTEKVERMVDGYVALEHGRNFSSMLPKIKLLSLLTSPLHNSKVSQYGEIFQTERKMFKTIFKKTFTPKQDIEITINQTSTNQALVVQKTGGDKKQILVDADSFASGEANSIKIAADEEVTIKFPVAVNEVKMSGLMCNRDGPNYEQQDYQIIRGTEQISASMVYAKHNHVMFISTDDQIMGMGYRAQGRSEGNFNLKIIERPENCVDIKKGSAGKFFRLILCNNGGVFYSGQNKHCTFGNNIAKDDRVNKFYELPKDFFAMDSDDKIVDLDGGKHFWCAVTKKGKVYASGSRMYNCIDESVRSNSESSSEYPFEIRLNTEQTEGFKALRCWANETYNYIWILAQKENVFKTFGIGDDYDVAGCGDGTGSPKWRSPKLPEGSYIKEIASEGMYAVGIDQEDNIWEWGNHKISNEENKEKFFEMPEGAENRNSTPFKWVWLKNNKKKPIKIATGRSWGIVQTEDIGSDNPGKIELYGWHEYGLDCKQFGQGAKQAYSNKFFLLGSNFNHADVVAFDGSREASYIILSKKIDSLPQILEDRAEDEDRQLVHFYHQRGQGWKYFEQKDWVMNMDKSPPLIYATRHPIKNWPEIGNDPALIPNLDEIISKAQKSNVSKSKQTWKGRVTTYGNLPVEGALYYAKFSINGQTREIISTLDQVMEGGQQFDMQPVIFYVLATPFMDPRELPVINCEEVFYQSKFDNEFLRFSITNADIDNDEIMNIQTDARYEEYFENLKNFDKEADFDLLRAIDRRILLFKDKKISDCKETQFDLKNFQLPINSKIKSMDSDLVQNRICLIFKFNQAVDVLLDDTFFEQDNNKNSIANKIKECSQIMLPSIKKRFFKKTLQEYWEIRNTQLSCPFNYDRKEAYDFMQKGIKGDPDFIHESTFGQLYQTMLLRDSEFGVNSNNSNSFDIQSFDFQPGDIDEDGGSAPFIFREIEKELMSDQLPLLIKVANGRHQAGIKRDCYTLNAKMTNPESMKCFQFLGSMIGRILVKDHLWFGVPFAPTFWMLVQDNEQPTLEDFAKEDARLRKRLNKLELAQKDGVWPEDEGFFWTTCDDKIYPISREQPQRPLSKEDLTVLERVNGDNINEFREQLLNRLTTENQEQIKHFKVGLKHTLGDFDFIRQFLNWHDLMDLAESKNNVIMKKNFDDGLQLFKENTIYMNCQEEDQQIKMFWKIYSEFNYENKKGYLNLVSGTSRLGDVKHRYAMSHRIRVDSSLAEGETPKSKASQFELILAPNYENAEAMKVKLLEAIAKGCGLDSDQD